MTRRARAWLAAWLAWVVLATVLVGTAIAAHPTPIGGAPHALTLRPIAAEPDTLDDYLDELADSTSGYFGVSAAPPDTAGLDSALAYGLAHPRRSRPRMRPSFRPDFAFNRVDGPTYTLGGSYGILREIGQFRAEGSYAAGPNDWLWHSDWTKTWGAPETPWRFQAGGGIETESIDRERTSRRLTSVRALLTGKDSHHYLRRKGWEVGLRKELLFAQLGVSYRDAREEPLVTTTGWTLFHQHLSIFDNLPAAAGRVHEIELGASFDLDPVPFRLEVFHHNSSPKLGSDFDYRRTRSVLSGDIGIGSWASFLPQAVYGRLGGDPIPQAMFFLGGSRSIRSMSSGDRAGTGYALGRLELIGTKDVLEVLRIPHPAFLPIQLGAFTGVGAVWGVDPYGGPRRGGNDWPEREHWVSEAGVSILYQPGFPNPTSLLRVNYAWPIGPLRESSNVSFSFSRAMDFLKTFGR